MLNRKTCLQTPPGTNNNMRVVRPKPSNVLSNMGLLTRCLYDYLARCDKYLCPHTLSCVHFPHHCPCAFPAQEEKVEFGDGSMACVTKGGWKEGESLRKIELARKGLL